MLPPARLRRRYCCVDMSAASRDIAMRVKMVDATALCERYMLLSEHITRDATI